MVFADLSADKTQQLRTLGLGRARRSSARSQATRPPTRQTRMLAAIFACLTSHVLSRADPWTARRQATSLTQPIGHAH